MMEVVLGGPSPMQLLQEDQTLSAAQQFLGAQLSAIVAPIFQKMVWSAPEDQALSLGGMLSPTFLGQIWGEILVQDAGFDAIVRDLSTEILEAAP